MTPNKLLPMLSVAGMLTLAGCAEDSLSVQVLNAMADSIDGSCVITRSELIKGAGSVNLAWTHSYLVALLIENHLEAEVSAASGGSGGNPPSKNDFYIREILLDYRTYPDEALILSQSVPDAAVVKAGGQLFGGFQLITGEMGLLMDGMGEAWVLVDIRLKGVYASGGEYETVPFRFPIWSFNAGTPYSCASPANKDDAPCGNWGQDGIYPECSP